MSEPTHPASLACLSEQQRKDAMARFAVLRPHLEEEVPLARAARQAGVPARTAQRWLSRYRANGLVGLARPVRRDAGNRKLAADFAALIEGLALRKPGPSIAAIHRQTIEIAKEKNLAAPSYATVHAIIRDLKANGSRRYRAFAATSRAVRARAGQSWPDSSSASA